MKKVHPVRAVIGGVLLGIGVTLLLLTYAKAPFGDATLWLPLVFFVILGLLLSLLLPARGATPASSALAGSPAPAPSPAAPPDASHADPTSGEPTAEQDGTVEDG